MILSFFKKRLLENWFEELDNGGSHLTADLIADNIVDIAQRYSVH